jgi:hypothetical protein
MAKRAAKRLSVHLWLVNLGEADRKMGDLRYFFRFPAWKRDDFKATRVGEAVLYTASAIYGPLLDLGEEAVVFRVPRGLIRDQEALSLDALIQLEKSREWSDRITDWAPRLIGGAMRLGDSRYQTVWELAPCAYANRKIFDAVRFLTVSQDNFYVHPGQISEVLSNPTETAATAGEQNRLETALLNAFKAVEAIIGDPPRDDRKLALRLRKWGLDPEEEVGYGSKKELAQMIRDANWQRDKKAAHGSTPSGDIRIVDMLEYQACARYIVIAALEHEAGQLQSSD